MYSITGDHHFEVFGVLEERTHYPTILIAKHNKKRAYKRFDKLLLYNAGAVGVSGLHISFSCLQVRSATAPNTYFPCVK